MENMQMRRALQVFMNMDKMTAEQIVAVGEVLLTNLWVLRWTPYELEGGFVDYVMDAGGNDDVAFRIRLMASSEYGMAMIALYLGKWVIRPSDFAGMVQVDEICDEEEEDRAWQKYESQLRELLYEIAEAIQSNCGAPIELVDGKIQIAAGLRISDTDSLEAQARQAILAAKWVERLDRTA
jgi:hypothetical protein